MLENKEFYIELNDKIFKVELIKFSDTLNKALVYIPEKNRLEDVYVNELIIKDKGEIKPLTEEEKIEYCKSIPRCYMCPFNTQDSYDHYCKLKRNKNSKETIQIVRNKLRGK